MEIKISLFRYCEDVLVSGKYFNTFTLHTAYFVEFIRASSSRMLTVDSWNGGGELR